jgi:hypothetical protein
MRSRLIISLFLLIGLLFPMEYSSSGAQRQGTFPGGQFALRASLSGRIPAREHLWICLRDALSHQPIIICDSLSDPIVTYQKNNGKKIKATLSVQRTDLYSESRESSPTPYVQYEGSPEEFSLLLDRIARDHDWEDSIGARPVVIVLFDKKLRIREVHVVSPFLPEENILKITTMVRETEGHWLFVKKSCKQYNAVVFIKRFS